MSEIETVEYDDEFNYYYDVCYECTGYGDDYYTDGDGNWVSACEDCWVTLNLNEWDDE